MDNFNKTMRYQIKEALDKISDLTTCDPNKITVDKVEPNNIRLSCINEQHTQVVFVYTDGELFLQTDGNKVRLPSED